MMTRRGFGLPASLTAIVPSFPSALRALSIASVTAGSTTWSSTSNASRSAWRFSIASGSTPPDWRRVFFCLFDVRNQRHDGAALVELEEPKGRRELLGPGGVPAAAGALGATLSMELAQRAPEVVDERFEVRERESMQSL
jgi:hypothetical protein